MAALGLDFALRRGNEEEIARETASYTVATPINIRYNGWDMYKIQKKEKLFTKTKTVYKYKKLFSKTKGGVRF